MKTLALVTSSPQASLVMADGLDVLFQAESTNQKTQSEFIHEALDRGFKSCSLSPREFNAFAVDIGPGRFTGVRIGLNVIKTFSYVNRAPIYPFDSLTLLANAVPLTLEGPLAILVNAFNNSVFLATFINDQTTWKCVHPPQVVPVEKLEEKISSPHLCVGDGYSFYEKKLSTQLKSLFKRNLECKDQPQAKTLISLLHSETTLSPKDWNSCQPLYLKRSAAEEKFG